MSSQTLFATDKVRLTVVSTTSAEDRAYYARAAIEAAEYAAAEKIRRAQVEAAKFNSLGDQLGAVIETDYSPLGEIKLEAIGKTEQGVCEAIAAYTARYPFNPYMTGFYAVNPYGVGFRAIGNRWDH